MICKKRVTKCHIFRVPNCHLENGENREIALDFNGFDSEEIIKK